MFIRESVVKSKGKTYRYIQIVKSVRSKDCQPAHKVLAKLGHMSDLEVQNLRLALQACREGKALVLPSDIAKKSWKIRVRINLEYLSVAVALEMWDYWELSELFNRLLRQGLELVAPSAVIAALSIQRCVDPGSKLYAQRWFPQTALPELLKVDSEHFTNSRLHRVLEQLDAVDEALQGELLKRYHQHDGVFSTLFMDVTDTWFQGRGCQMAAKNRTKEGLRNRYRVGIALMCNEHGYPMRWKVVGGKRQDPQALSDLLEAIEGIDWLGKAPLICDRAMGRARCVGKLVKSGLRFLTATTRQEYDSYTQAIPFQAVSDYAPPRGEFDLEEEVRKISQRIEQAGFHAVEKDLFVKDLGVEKRMLEVSQEQLPATGTSRDLSGLRGAALSLAKARLYQEQLEKKAVQNFSELATREGVSRARITQIMNFLRLEENLQERLLAGEFGYVPEHRMREIVKHKDAETQREALEEHALDARPMQTEGAQPQRARTGNLEVSLRLVAYFNPYMFIEQRQNAARHLRRVEEFIAELNRKQYETPRTPAPDRVMTKVVNRLVYQSLFGVYEISVDEQTEGEGARRYLQVRLRFKEEEWRHRRRYDGFVLLVGHPELPHSGTELVKLYRAKDKIEKDFRTIKEVVKLRPVYHYTDPKVRAHVTLCMLALLLERTLERRLEKSTLPMTAPACFERLAGCHLNMVKDDPDLPVSYTVTDATQEQEAILRSLRKLHLVNDDEVAARIQPRARV